MILENKNLLLNIKPGMFYNGLEGFSIKIEKKNDNGVDLEGIMIYDHNKKSGNNKIIIAKEAPCISLIMSNTSLFL